MTEQGQEAAPNPEFEADLDAALAALDMGDEGPAAEAPQEPEEEPEGDVEPEAAPEGEEPQEKSEEAPEAQALDLADEDSLEAYNALRRDGLTHAEILGMPRDRVLQYGATRAKVQKDTDAAYRRLRSLPNATDSAAEPEGNGSTKGPDSLPEGFAAAVGPIADELGLGADASETLGRGFHAAVQSVVGPLLERVQAESDAMTAYVAETARQGLGERFPGLRDDEKFAQVGVRMQELMSSKAVLPGLSGPARVRALMERGAKDMGLGESSDSDRKQPVRRKKETPDRPRRATGGRKNPQSFEASVDDALKEIVGD